MRTTKIGFVGLGVVGGAVAKAFASSFETVGYDIRTAPDTKKDLLSTDMIFLSLPTPTANGRQNQLPLDSTCQYLGEHGFKGVVVVKSTVVPGTSERLAKTYGLRVVHNPEFLTEKRPLEDFMNQESVLLGGNKEDVDLVAEVYLKILPGTAITYATSARVTEIAKYTHNLFLATKVGFLNEIFRVCELAGVRYDSVLAATLSQGKLGKTHTNVPNIEAKSNTASFGFGGMCFPKDIQALITWAREQGLELEQMNATNEANLKRRPETSLK